jgi:hypothetical protein
MVFGSYLYTHTQQSHGSSHVIYLLVEIFCYKYCCVQLYIFFVVLRRMQPLARYFYHLFIYLCMFDFHHVHVVCYCWLYVTNQGHVVDHFAQCSLPLYFGFQINKAYLDLCKLTTMHSLIAIEFSAICCVLLNKVHFPTFVNITKFVVFLVISLQLEVFF